MDIYAMLQRLNPAAAKQYRSVADIIGPIGQPALDQLLEAVWFTAISAAEDDNL